MFYSIFTLSSTEVNYLTFTHHKVTSGHMKIFVKIFWTVWLLSIILLLMTLNVREAFDAILLLVLFTLTGVNMYVQESHDKTFERISKIVGDVDLKPLERGIEKIRKQQNAILMRNMKLEMNLEKLEAERERKYRDVVKKVLDMDNKLNEKFKLLGESIIKISKGRKDQEQVTPASSSM